MRAFASATQEAIHDVENKADQALIQIGEHKKHIDARFAASKKGILEINEELRQEFTDLEKCRAAPGGNANPPAASGFISRHERTTACLGNLDWDLAPEKLQKRVLGSLKEVSVNTPAVDTSISVPGNCNISFTNVEFATNQKLVECKERIDRLKRLLREDD